MILLEVLYIMMMGRFIPLTGIPTPGGAPLSIHVMNMGIKGAWSALVYGLVMRWAFGKVVWSRVALLWLVGIAVVAVLGGLAAADLIPVAVAGWVGLAAYWATGQFIARDWASQ